jgi:hypothetical protein
VLEWRERQRQGAEAQFNQQDYQPPSTHARAGGPTPVEVTGEATSTWFRPTVARVSDLRARDAVTTKNIPDPPLTAPCRFDDPRRRPLRPLLCPSNDNSVTMSAKRDSSFPASSIGRSSGAAMLRSVSPSPSLTPSRESLTAHPLLSPSHTPPPQQTIQSSPTEQSNSSPTTARYATYTPRHRTAAAATVTVTSSSPVSPQHQQVGGAATKLQLVNLKAFAQSIGVETGSVGWDMLEYLLSEHEHSTEWTDICNALTTGKVRLLSHGGLLDAGGLRYNGRTFAIALSRLCTCRHVSIELIGL